MIVDRAARDQLIEAIDRYLHEELTAFEFDDAVFEIQTPDETVRNVSSLLWPFYDDFKDHKVHLSTEGWNLFHRLRLLLMSSASLEASVKRVWSWGQGVAAFAVGVFLLMVASFGVGVALLLSAIPAALLANILKRWRKRLYDDNRKIDLSLYPFDSLQQMLWIGHDVSDFQKGPYPKHLAARRVRNNVAESMLSWLDYPFRPLAAPFQLFFQLLPVSIPMRRVIVEAGTLHEAA